jgi:hypothetical protein
MGAGSSSAAASNPGTSPHRRGGEEELVEWKWVGKGAARQAHTSLDSSTVGEREREWIWTAIPWKSERSTERKVLSFCNLGFSHD